MEISAIIAIILKRIREERKLSMGQLAEMAGVSKVVLSQLEKGTANPTINTIWKITGALGLPYSSLLEMPETNAIHVKKKDLQDMCDDGYHIFTYYGKEPARPFELYEIVVDPGAEHDSIGHSSESSEYIIVTEGELEIGVNGDSYTLDPDDGLCFEAAVPHTYRNRTETRAKAVLMIFYR